MAIGLFSLFLLLLPGYLVYEINRWAGRVTLLEYLEFMLWLAVGSLVIPGALLFGLPIAIDAWHGEITIDAWHGEQLRWMFYSWETSPKNILDFFAVATTLYLLPHSIALTLNYLHREQKFYLGASIERKRLIRDVAQISLPALAVTGSCLFLICLDTGCSLTESAHIRRAVQIAE